MIKSYYGEPQQIAKLKDINPVYMTSESPDTIIQSDWLLSGCKNLEKEKVDRLCIWIAEWDENAGSACITYLFDNHKDVKENSSPF